MHGVVMSSRPKRVCVKPVQIFEDEDEKENFDDVDEQPRKKSKAKLVSKLDADKDSSDESDNQVLTDSDGKDSYDEKDIEYWSEDEMYVEDTNHNNIPLNAEKPKLAETIPEIINNTAVLDKYYPYGLDKVTDPINTDLLFLFKTSSHCELSNFFKGLDGSCYYGNLMEVLYMQKSAVFDEERFYSEKYEIIDNPTHDSSPLMSLRPVFKSDVIKRYWYYEFMDIGKFYKFLFDDYSNLIKFKSPTLKIYVQGKSLVFYLKMDENSLQDTLKSMTPAFFDLVSRNLLKGNMFSCDKVSQVISDTFDFPEAVISPGFKLNLRDYQLRTVSWMQSIEAAETRECNNINNNTTSQDKECRMKIRLGSTPYYMDLKERQLTESAEAAEIKPLRFNGGILADDTGSGKTISVLGLIHSTPLNAEAERDRLIPSQFIKSRASCIICPSNIYQQWINEAKKCNPKFVVVGLSTIIQHGKYSWNDIINADIVVVSYQFLQNANYRKVWKEATPKLVITRLTEKHLNEKGTILLHKLDFHRIILDEFHELDANKKEIQQYVRDMRAEYVWGLTGTPKLSQSREQFRYFNPSDRFIDVYESNCNARIEFQRKFIKRNVPNLMLPPIQNETVWVDLSPQEITLMKLENRSASLKAQIMRCTHYQLSEQKTVAKNEFISINTVQEQFSSKKKNEVDKLKRELLAEIKEIDRMIEEHPGKDVAHKQSRVKEIEKRLKSAESAYNYFQSVFKMIGEPDKNECRICYDTISTKSLSILPCSHIYCYECITLALERKKECPLCNHKVNNVSEVYRITMTESEVLNEQLQAVDLSKYGSKLIALYNYLTNLMAQDPNARIILFLQYSDLADFMAESFKELNIKCVRVTGNVFQRRNAITNFKESKDVRLIMMSSEDSVSGINLTEATHVILLHPFWTDQGEDVDRAYEKQGISRAYRMGLDHPLKVVRFATRGTVEEKITLKRENVPL